MKLVIAGGRDIKFSTTEIDMYVRHYKLSPSEIVSGGATGIDSSGEAWARERNVPIRKFEPEWYKHGRAAGPLRNKQMAEYGDALLIIWNGNSPGSKSMKNEMLKLGKPVYEVVTV